MKRPKHLKEEIFASCLRLELHLSRLVRAPKGTKSRKQKCERHVLKYWYLIVFIPKMWGHIARKDWGSGDQEFLKQKWDISLLNHPSGSTFPTKSQTQVNSITKLEQHSQGSFDNGSEWPENHPKYYQNNYPQNILEVTKCWHPVFCMFTSVSRSYMGQGVSWFSSAFSSVSLLPLLLILSSTWQGSTLQGYL